MKINVIIYTILFNAIGSAAQVKNNEIKIAEEYFNHEKYPDAVHYFLKLLKKDSLNSNLNFQTGICYLNSRSQKHKAIPYFERAVLRDNTFSLPAVIYEYLGDGYHLDKQFDKAVYAYKNYKAILSGKGNDNSAAIAEINWKIEMSEVCKRISIDTALYSNYNTLFSTEGSKLTLTFYKQATNKDQAFFMDFYNIVSESVSLPADTAKCVQNEATIGTSPDAQNILIYRNEEGSGNLYTASMEGNKWSVPHKLDKKINDKGWEDGESVSSDNATLYFTSDREGGFGGKDIYLCKKLVTGDWGEAINLGPTINSAYDEEAPLIHPDGKIIYFSSNKYTHGSSFDIFRSYYVNDGSWTFPVNVGYPSEKGKNENYASSTVFINEKKSKGLITFVDGKDAKLTVLSGYATDPAGKSPEKIKITVEEKETGEVSGVYKTTGNFSFLLPQNENNIITYEARGYLFISENIDLSENNIPAANKIIKSFIPINSGSVVELNNIFFENGKEKILQSSCKQLNRLVELLSTEQNIVIELSGYINSQENKKYYARLSEKRVQSVIEYLVSKGIAKERLILKNHEVTTVLSQKEKSFEKAGIFSIDQKIELKILEADPKKSNSLTTQ